MAGVETPEKKQNFDWIYEETTPVAYKTEILDGRTYICDNFTRQEFDRVLLPKVQTLLAGGKEQVRVVDLGSCFGNTSMAIVNGMTTDQIKENWKDTTACKAVKTARRFPCHLTTVDISESALKYTVSAGIADAMVAANLNSPEGLARVLPVMKGADLFFSTATLIYLTVESVNALVKEFASGGGDGYAIVNFLNPFELEKTDEMKRILLEHLEFVGSTASRHRTLSPKEQSNYPGYGDWALLEIWTLRRRTRGAQPEAKVWGLQLLGMGNPLLDISSEVDQKLLDKYQLKAGDAILAEEKHQPLFGEMVKMPKVQYIAGGATQNSIRVAQWMMQKAGATAYMGCVGKDENGQKLQKACETDGVKAMYMVDASTPTGVCATLITGIERSLCTNLNAANNYKVEHCKEAAQWKVVQDAKIVYSAGFFATVSPAAIKAAAQEKAKDGGIYCMNLSAPFLMQVPPFKAVFLETMPYVDFLFGNETEALTWAETEGWETTNIKFIATRLSLLPSAKSRKRTVVITQGCDPTIVCVQGNVSEYPIITLPKDKLVDTNGAGDSYVGGFLAGLAKGLPIADCCKAGAHAASVIVQQSGCTFPTKQGYTL